MKKISKVLILSCMMMLIMSLCFVASAEGSVIKTGTMNSNGNITFTLYSDGELRLSGYGDMGYRHSNYYYLFNSYESSIKRIVVGEGISSISSSLILEKDYVVTVELPSTLKAIGDNTFEDCTSLRSVNIPEGVTSIGTYAFSDCDALTSIILPRSITQISDKCFYGCDALSSITIPNSITSIGSYAFSDCIALKQIVIPDSVTSLGTYAFEDCSALSKVTLSKKLTSISDYAFRNCTALTSIVIPEGVTSIGERSFYNCKALTSVSFPSTLTSIDYYAFELVDNVYSLVLPAALTSLDYSSLPQIRKLIVLNKNLSLTSSKFSDLENVVIISYPGSGAETFANSSVYGATLKFQSIYCAAPEITGATNTKTGITINWKASTNANKYIVYRKKSSDSSWTQLASLGSNVYSYQDTSAAAGAKYIYTVRADNQWERGTINNTGITVVRLVAPTISKTASSSKGIKVTWNKVAGATKYFLYRDGKKVAEVTGTSYTDAAVQYNKSYTYTVYAATAAEKSVASAGFKAKMSVVASTEITASVVKMSQIKITWTKIPGADSYAVYRSTNSKKGFKKIATVKKGNSYVDKKATFGKKYYYKVVTIDSKKKSNSNVFGITSTISAAKFSKSVNVTAKTITLKWGKVSEADGYTLYIKSGKKWKKITTIKSNSTTSYKYSTKSGGNFKIVAFKKKNGKTFNSVECTAYFKPLAAPTGFSISQYEKEFEEILKWKKVSGATSYQVHRKIEDGKWQKVTDVTAVKYQTKVTHGKWYYWKVKAVYEKDGYKSVSDFSAQKTYQISYLPNFTGFVSDRYSSSKFCIIIIDNNGPVKMRIKKTGRIFNGASYPSMNGDIVLIDTKMNRLKYQDIPAGESVSVCFENLADTSWYDSDTRLTFYFDYDGRSYCGITDPERYGLNKVTYYEID